MPQTTYRSLPLDPFQQEAIQAIEDGKSLLVAAPTGAGKTLIAEYAVDRCLREGKRAVYTAPIKALSNQKFRDFTAAYGDRIGIKTGDVTLNADAQIVLMTTEIFRNTIFESPRHLESVSTAVFDEIHFLDDIERGTVWEESIIFAPPHIRFLCLSATIPNLNALARWIRQVRPDVPLHVILEEKRPVPLQHKIYVPSLGIRSVDELKEMDKSRRPASHLPRVQDDAWRRKLIDHLQEADRLPAIFFAFNRRDCEDFSFALHKSLLDEEERAQILGLYDSLCARFAIDPDATSLQIRGLLGRGAAYHHAGLLPTLKEVIERIFTSGLLRILFATETFAVGVNMPARTVVFNTLYKFDGRRLGYVRTREHHQMSGRAGRRGIDQVGYVYSVAEWPHIRAAEIEQIISGPIEPIRSQFNLSYATILTLYEHLGDRIYQACEKSLANFVSRRRGKQAAGDLKEQMKRKILLLRSLGYLQGDRLTRKGMFARNLHGYELPVTELYFQNLLHRLDEHELSVLFCALVYESKKGQWFRKLDFGKWKHLKRSAHRAVEEILYAEESLGVEDRTKELDFKLASAALAWSRGAPFRDLEGHTGAADGDLVRFLRLTIQLLRNTQFACAKDDPLRETLRAAVRSLSRDEVDAERQLRMGTDAPLPEAGPDPREGLDPAASEPGP